MLSYQLYCFFTRQMLDVKAEDQISSVTTNGFQRILHLQSND